MPTFGLDQQDEMTVWQLAHANAEAAGYFSSRRNKKEAKPLAATAFAAGFMGGALKPARRSRRGLWKDDDVISPWEYRKVKRKHRN